MSYLSDLDAQIEELKRKRAYEESISSKVTEQEKAEFLENLKSGVIPEKVYNELGFSSKDAYFINPMIIKRVTSWGSKEVENSGEFTEISALSQEKPLVNVSNNKSSKRGYTYSEFMKEFYGVDTNVEIPLKDSSRTFKTVSKPLLHSVVTKDSKITSIYYAIIDEFKEDINFNRFSLYDKLLSYNDSDNVIRSISPLLIEYRGKNYISCTSDRSIVSNWTTIDFSKYNTFNVYHISKEVFFNIMVSILTVAFPDISIYTRLAEAINKNKGKNTVLGNIKIDDSLFKINKSKISMESLVVFFYLFTLNLCKDLGYSEEDSVDMTVSVFKNITIFSAFDLTHQGGYNQDITKMSSDKQKEMWLSLYEAGKNNIIRKEG